MPCSAIGERYLAADEILPRSYGAGDQLNTISRLIPFSPLLFILLIVASSAPCLASSGNHWTYDISMNVAGLNASGTVTYKLQGQASLDLGSKTYKADAMEISGQVSAQGKLLGIPTSVTEILGGTRYCQNDGMSLIKDDSVTILNISLGSSPIQLLSRTETETVTTFSPPYLSKFDSGRTGPGNAWTETDTVNTTISVNGTALPLISTQASYTVQVASSRVVLATEAGTFVTLEISVLENTDFRTVYWWSEEVQNLVAEKKFGPGATQPYMAMSLKDFETSSNAESTFAVIVGVVLIAVAVAILAVLLGARRPRSPASQHPPQAPHS